MVTWRDIFKVCRCWNGNNNGHDKNDDNDDCGGDDGIIKRITA